MRCTMLTVAGWAHAGALDLRLGADCAELALLQKLMGAESGVKADGNGFSGVRNYKACSALVWAAVAERVLCFVCLEVTRQKHSCCTRSKCP